MRHTTDVESLTQDRDIVAEPNLRHPQARTFSMKTRISPFARLTCESLSAWEAQKFIARETPLQKLRMFLVGRHRGLNGEFWRVASLIDGLFGVAGVEQVMVEQYAVTIILAERFEWDERMGHVEARIYAHLVNLYGESPSS